MGVVVASIVVALLVAVCAAVLVRLGYGDGDREADASVRVMLVWLEQPDRQVLHARVDVLNRTARPVVISASVRGIRPLVLLTAAAADRRTRLLARARDAGSLLGAVETGRAGSWFLPVDTASDVVRVEVLVDQDEFRSRVHTHRLRVTPAPERTAAPLPDAV